MSAEKVFSFFIRIIFLAAFGAFLLASLRHIAVFFQDFEPGNAGDWGSYALAWSIDGTALILAFGVMFFSRKINGKSKALIWFFIVALTCFSWLVNWEYAATYQGTELTNHLPGFFRDINPILASSFAFLNLAYSIVAEAFNAKKSTVAELQAELDSLTGPAAELQRKIDEARGPGLIDAAKNVAIKAKKAAAEIKAASRKETTGIATSTTLEPEQKIEEPAPEKEAEEPVILDMIERRMFNAIQDLRPKDLAELLNLADTKNLDEFTEILRQRYQKFAGFINTSNVAHVLAAFRQEKRLSDLAPKPEQLLNQTGGENWQYIDPMSGPNLTQNQPEFLSDPGPITDPNLKASTQESGELYSVELPPDVNEDGPPTTQFEAILGMRGQTSFTPYEPASQNSAPPAPAAPAKKLTGMDYREAAKLAGCKAADIRAAVNSRALATYRDGSVSRAAVEKWAKSRSVLNGVKG